MNDFTTNWRGDEIARCINDELDKQMIKNGGTIYDCCNNVIPVLPNLENIKS